MPTRKAKFYFLILTLISSLEYLENTFIQIQVMWTAEDLVVLPRELCCYFKMVIVGGRGKSPFSNIMIFNSRIAWAS